MNKSKYLLLASLLAAISSSTIAVLGSFNEPRGDFGLDLTCKHSHVECYEALAPDLGSMGHMKHYACCTCHQAWMDEGLTMPIGNTGNDRSKIDILPKTQGSLISKSAVSGDSIVLIDETTPNVIGLDQTRWTERGDGKGSGSFQFYSIDERTALRVSSESLSSSQYRTIDSSNNGYSQWQFCKKAKGKISVTFDYKMYDLDTSSYLSEPRTQAVFKGKTSTVSELSLIGDNAWHSLSFSCANDIEMDNLVFKIHHFKGELYISNLSISGTTLEAPILEQRGNEVFFAPVKDADYYLIHDSNDSREAIKIDPTSISPDGKYHYLPKVAGDHDIYVSAHTDSEYVEPSSSNLISGIEIEPSFYYDQFANEYFIRPEYSGNTDDLPADYKNSFEDWGEYYHSYITPDGKFTNDWNSRMDLSKGAPLDKIISNSKKLGTNVLLVSYGDGCVTDVGSSTTFAISALKNIMDKAWENGLKVIAYSSLIYTECFSDHSYEATKQSIWNYLSSSEYGLPLIQHKAFYGFMLKDEPQYRNGEYLQVSSVIRILSEFFDNNYSSLGLAVRRPFMLSALLPYNQGSVAQSFDNITQYSSYITSWLDATGLDYICFDLYTYTTTTYPLKRILCDETLDLEYDCLMKIVTSDKYRGVKIHQTTTSNNNKDIRPNGCTYADIYGSTLFAAAFNNYGISRFTYFPAVFTYEWNNGIVDRLGNEKENFQHAVGAQSQFDFIKTKLHGFSVTDYSFTTSGSYGGSRTTRRANTTLSNGEHEYQMVVNYNSALNGSSFSVSVPSGKSYYLFGLGKDMGQRISSGTSITLQPATAILITDETINNRDLTIGASEFASSFGKKGTSDVNGFDFNVEKGVLEIDILSAANPYAWLNNITGGSSFYDICNVSSSMTIEAKAESGKDYNIRLLDYKKGRETEYKMYASDPLTATGDWDQITIQNYETGVNSFGMYFFFGNANVGDKLIIRSITFHGIDAPYFAIEQLSYFDYVTVSDVEGLSSPMVVNNVRSDYEGSLHFNPSNKNASRSYRFAFRFKASDFRDSCYFFFEGNTPWSGVEFILMGGGYTQIYLPSIPSTSGNGFYTLSPNKEHIIEFGLIRVQGFGSIFSYIKVDNLYWNRFVFSDDESYSTSHFGLYHYSASTGTVATLSDI